MTSFYGMEDGVATYLFRLGKNLHGCSPMKSTISRLGEYEDTGMSPAEIMSMQKENEMLRARLNEAIRSQRLGGSANRIVQNTLATALNAIGGSLMKQALHLRMLEQEARKDMEERADQMENGERRRIPWEAD